MKMRKAVKILTFAIITAILAVCASEKTPGNLNAAKFCIPDSIMPKITFDTVSYQPVINEFNLIGKVTYDQDKVVKLYPMVSGNVLDVKATLGDYVVKGQVLAIIKSTEITGAENDIVSIKAGLPHKKTLWQHSRKLKKQGRN
jgi:cobalt-zinc-cadmium efflux system membrane fusion protein